MSIGDHWVNGILTTTGNEAPDWEWDSATGTVKISAGSSWVYAATSSTTWTIGTDEGTWTIPESWNDIIDRFAKQLAERRPA